VRRERITRRDQRLGRCALGEQGVLDVGAGGLTGREGATVSLGESPVRVAADLGVGGRLQHGDERLRLGRGVVDGHGVLELATLLGEVVGRRGHGEPGQGD